MLLRSLRGEREAKKGWYKIGWALGLNLCRQYCVCFKNYHSWYVQCCEQPNFVYVYEGGLRKDISKIRTVFRMSPFLSQANTRTSELKWFSLEMMRSHAMGRGYTITSSPSSFSASSLGSGSYTTPDTWVLRSSGSWRRRSGLDLPNLVSTTNTTIITIIITTNIIIITFSSPPTSPLKSS